MPAAGANELNVSADNFLFPIADSESILKNGLNFENFIPAEYSSLRLSSAVTFSPEI